MNLKRDFYENKFCDFMKLHNKRLTRNSDRIHPLNDITITRIELPNRGFI